jgi:phosphoesterase RecJ-like protein
VDVASPLQLGSLAPLIPKIDIMIDHHCYGEPFAPSLIVPDISACGEVMFDIFRIIYEKKLISKSCAGFAARALYAAVSSDTGSFKYSNVTADTLRTAAYLMEIIKTTEGIAADDISRRLHDTRTLGALKATCLAVEKLHMYCGGAMAVTVIERSEMARFGVADEDTGSIVDVPRSVEGVLCAVAIKEKGDGGWKVSSRSSVDINMASVCAGFGGGGHVRAAGCSLPAMSSGDALKTVADAFGSAVELYLEKEIH